MLYFCSNLCNFSCADRVNCQHLFLDFYLLCLPNISLCFRAAFLDILVHLFWLPFRDELLIAQPQFYNHDYFPAKQQQREAENVNKLVSVLLCCTPHSPLASFACFSCFFHQYRQLQAAPSSTNLILHNVLLGKKRQCDDFQAVSSSRGFFLKAASTAY